MINKPYKPRKLAPQMLKGAPEAVIAIVDNGGKTAGRYMVLYGAPIWSQEYGRTLPMRTMSENPGHPQGVSMFGTCWWAGDLSRYGELIRFADLPEACREHVIRDCENSWQCGTSR